MPESRFSILSSSTLRIRKRGEEGPTVGGRTISMPFNPQGNFPAVMSQDQLDAARTAANENMARHEAEVAQAKKEASLRYRMKRRVKNFFTRCKKPFRSNKRNAQATGGLVDIENGVQNNQVLQADHAGQSAQGVHANQEEHGDDLEIHPVNANGDNTNGPVNSTGSPGNVTSAV